MKKNMGPTDRAVRVLLAIVMLVLIGMEVITGAVAIVLGVLALVFLLTSFVSTCPLYLPFGLSTIRKKFHDKSN